MQFLRYEACGSQAGVEAELSRLLAEGFLTARQARAVNRQWIGDFFRTELGQRLQRGQDVLREFKFSILADGRILQEDLTGEKLLLQGVVDCCFMEEDGITVLDFKTDRVRPWGRGGRGRPLWRTDPNLWAGAKPDFWQAGEEAAAVFFPNWQAPGGSLE